MQFSYLPRAACRSTPNHPRASGVDGGGDGGERESCWWTGETADRGLKRPIEDLQTRCHPLSPASSLHNLLFPSNLSQPRSAILHVLARPSPSSTSANVPTGLPRPTADPARWRTALQNRAKCKTLKIRGLKFQCAVTIYRDYTHVSSPQSHICIFFRDLF